METTFAFALAVALGAAPPQAAPASGAGAEGAEGDPPGGAVIVKPDRPGSAAQQALDALAEQDRARFPDGASRALRAALEQGFAPPFSVLEGEPAGGLGSVSRAAAGRYLESAEAYGRTGSPSAGQPVLDRPGAATARAGVAGHEMPESSAAWEGQTARVDGNLAPPAWTRRLETVVELQQDATGRVISARVLRSSGNATHDRLALAQAEKLRGEVVELPAGEAGGGRSAWSFETDLSMVPPAPVVGIGFDAHFRPTEVVYPLKTDVRSRVRLVSVGR